MQNVRINSQFIPSMTEICDRSTEKQMNEKVYVKVLGPEKESSTS